MVKVLQTVFLHIPKTAGTSITEVMRSRCGNEGFCNHIFDNDLKAMSKEDAVRFRFFAGHFTYQTVSALMPAATVFTFLRNPVDRIVSLIQYWRAHSWEWVKEHPAHSAGVAFAKTHTLLEILNSPAAVLRANLNNVYIRTFAERGHFGPTGNLLVDSQLALERAIVNAEKLLYVGFVEDIDESLRQLFALLRWAEVPVVPRRNTAADGYFRPERAPLETAAVVAMAFTDEERLTLERNAQLDMQFYRHFRRKACDERSAVNDP